MARELYVYYKVDAARLLAAAAAARQLQERLIQRWPGLRMSVLRRPGEDQGQVTLMETYAAIDAASLAVFSATLAAEVAAEVAAGRLPASRHDEWFEPLT